MKSLQACSVEERVSPPEEARRRRRRRGREGETDVRIGQVAAHGSIGTLYLINRVNNRSRKETQGRVQVRIPGLVGERSSGVRH